MPHDPHKAQLFSTLQTFFSEIDGVKAAAVAPPRAKSAADGIADPGGYDGKSTHPSADAGVADHLHAEQTGSRFSENTADVKDDIGEASIENLPEEASSPSKGSGTQDKRQMNIGVHNAATGEDTAVERDFKSNKDDPGTTSVMKADDGQKYGSWSMKKLAGHIGGLGDEILADIVNGLVKGAGIGDNTPNRTHKVGQPPARAAGKKGGDDPAAVKEAAARGYELASVLGLQDMSDEEAAAGLIETVIKEASYHADLVADFLIGYDQTLQKSAAGEHPDGGAGEDHSADGDGASGAGEASAMGGDPGSAGGAGGGDAASILSQLPPEVLQQLVAAVQSGQLGGGGGMGGAQGAMAGMSGAGGGGMGPPGAGGTPPGGAPPGLSDDQTNDQLAGSMQDMQVSPDQLEGMAGKVASADQRQFLLKLAERVRRHVRSGKYDSTKRASTPAEANLRSEMRGYLSEILGSV